MSKIKSRNTKPEMIVRRYLHKSGLRFSLHNSKLPGSPDIVFKSRKVIVFVNGCFWHGHMNCSKFKIPLTNVEFWTNKILSNVERDRKNKKQLRQLGYRVFTVWQCQLNSKTQEKTLSGLVCKIKG